MKDKTFIMTNYPSPLKFSKREVFIEYKLEFIKSGFDEEFIKMCSKYSNIEFNTKFIKILNSYKNFNVTKLYKKKYNYMKIIIMFTIKNWFNEDLMGFLKFINCFSLLSTFNKEQYITNENLSQNILFRLLLPVKRRLTGYDFIPAKSINFLFKIFDKKYEFKRCSTLQKIFIRFIYFNGKNILKLIKKLNKEEFDELSLMVYCSFLNIYEYKDPISKRCSITDFKSYIKFNTIFILKPEKRKLFLNKILCNKELTSIIILDYIYFFYKDIRFDINPYFNLINVKENLNNFKKYKFKLKYFKYNKDIYKQIPKKRKINDLFKIKNLIKKSIIRDLTIYYIFEMKIDHVFNLERMFNVPKEIYLQFNKLTIKQFITKLSLPPFNIPQKDQKEFYKLLKNFPDFTEKKKILSIENLKITTKLFLFIIITFVYKKGFFQISKLNDYESFEQSLLPDPEKFYHTLLCCENPRPCNISAMTEDFKDIKKKLKKKIGLYKVSFCPGCYNSLKVSSIDPLNYKCITHTKKKVDFKKQTISKNSFKHFQELTKRYIRGLFNENNNNLDVFYKYAFKLFPYITKQKLNWIKKNDVRDDYDFEEKVEFKPKTIGMILIPPPKYKKGCINFIKAKEEILKLICNKTKSIYRKYTCFYFLKIKQYFEKNNIVQVDKVQGFSFSYGYNDYCKVLKLCNNCGLLKLFNNESTKTCCICLKKKNNKLEKVTRKNKNKKKGKKIYILKVNTKSNYMLNIK